MPQIIMLQHAGWVEKKRTDIRIKRNRAEPTGDIREHFEANMPTWNGRPIDQLTSDEYIAYHASAGNG
jgi:hypothetical protein